jgi:AbrB family looped-hinge helix DNA binding protein
MRARITRQGDDLVVTLPANAREALGLEDGTEVEVAVEGNRLTVTPAGATPTVSDEASSLASDVDPELAAQLADFIQRYRPALEALAR